MILKASQRSGAKQLGAHLLKTEENEHVEIHEVSGFVSDTVEGAMMEAYALSRGTRCQQYLFSVSLNPPAGESVAVEVFENALRKIEERNGLEGQPRIVVFHEKEGRRHCHAVWSRIDAHTMTAKPLSFFKMKLRDIAKELFIENGWDLPKGFVDQTLRDPRSFTLEEWQRSKRAGFDPKVMKEAALECWAMSDNGPAFTKAMEERGLFVARGDRRGHVAVTIEGEVFVVSKLVDKRAREVVAKLGSPEAYPSLADTLVKLGGDMGVRLKGHVAEAKRIAANVMKPLLEKRDAMKFQHQNERRILDEGQAARQVAEKRERAERVRGGLLGAWDFLTGRYAKLRKQNEVEAFFSAQRDRAQRDSLVRDQLQERSALQASIRTARERNARQVLGLYRDAARYRLMRERSSLERGSGLELG